MAGIVRLPPSVSAAKGVIPYCIERISREPEARPRMQALHAAISALSPTFAGLEDVFDQHLVAPYFPERVCEEVRGHLKSDWFDPLSPAAFFPGEDVVAIYALGTLKALELSLAGPEITPINSWWLVDCLNVQTLVLTDAASHDLTAAARVTFLILTSRPAATTAPVSTNPILGPAQAFAASATTATLRQLHAQSPQSTEP